MAAADSTPDSGTVDRAINQVLAAEREAREAVELCRAEAAQILAEAEDRAHRIGHRTERRIKLAHRVADQAVGRALLELQGPDFGSGSGIATPEKEAAESLNRAVDQLVDEILTGST